MCTVPGDAQTTSGCRRSCLFQGRVSWRHSTWQVALNLSSRGRAQRAVPNRHLRQACRLAPVSRSICCTSARPRHCARRTRVSWVTLKLISGLRGSDSWPDEAWRKPRQMPWENALIRPYHTSFCALHVGALKGATSTKKKNPNVHVSLVHLS